MSTKLSPIVEAHDVRRVSVLAEVDPRTVRRVIDGLPTKAVVRGRVNRALKDAGLGHLVAGPDAQLASPGDGPRVVYDE